MTVRSIDPMQNGGEDLNKKHVSNQPDRYSGVGTRQTNPSRHNKNSTNLPSIIKFIMPNKVGVITTKRVQDERFVRLWDFRLSEASLVRQIHLGRERASIQPGRFGIELEVHRLGRLDPDNEFVTGDVFEDALSDILELNSDLNFGFVQC